MQGILGSNIDASAEPTFVGKVVLWLSVIVSVLVMSWLSHVFGMPSEPGFSVALFQQDHWVLSLFVLLVGLLLIMFVSAGLTASLRTDAPVFCTSLACCAITWRGGTMQSTLFYASRPAVFVSLAVETLILFAILIGAWLLLRRLRGTPIASTVEADGLDEQLLAVFTQASAMMALMILLCRSDAKDQCLAAVAVSSAVAAAVAVQLVKVRSAFWLWIGPMAVACFGYVFSAFHAEGWQTGLLHGPLAALSRPLPLDYLSMGPAGAIFGYWLSGGGESEPGEKSEATPQVSAA